MIYTVTQKQSDEMRRSWLALEGAVHRLAVALGYALPKHKKRVKPLVFRSSTHTIKVRPARKGTR